MGYYTEAAKQLINPMDVPTFFIECAQTEHQLFEGLIELDFAQIYNEAGIISLTEADEEKANDAAASATNDTTDNIWTKFINAIKHAFEKIKEAFNKFLASVGSHAKILDDPKVKDCKKEDVWFADYKAKCDEYLTKENIKDYIAGFGKDILKKAGSEGDEVIVKTAEKITKDLDTAKEMISKIPTNADEYTNGTNGKNKNLLPGGLKKLGDQNMAALKECLSLKGLTQRISAAFNMLSKDDRSNYKIQKDDSDDLKKAKREASKHVTKMRLEYFMTECKVCSTTAKIARANYSAIKAVVKGKEGAEENKAAENTKAAENNNNAEQKATGEAVALACVASDFFCESIFEF